MNAKVNDIVSFDFTLKGIVKEVENRGTTEESYVVYALDKNGQPTNQKYRVFARAVKEVKKGKPEIIDLDRLRKKQGKKLKLKRK